MFLVDIQGHQSNLCDLCSTRKGDCRTSTRPAERGTCFQRTDSSKSGSFTLSKMISFTALKVSYITYNCSQMLQEYNSTIHFAYFLKRKNSNYKHIVCLPVAAFGDGYHFVDAGETTTLPAGVGSSPIVVHCGSGTL